MNTIQVNIKDVFQTVGPSEVESLRGAAVEAVDKVNNGTGAGNDFLGWVTLPTDTPSSLVADIKATAAELRADCDVVITPGSGRSVVWQGRVITRRRFELPTLG